MRYVFYVKFPSSYNISRTIHMQYVDDLTNVQTLIKEWSLDDDRYEFEIVTVNPTTIQG